MQTFWTDPRHDAEFGRKVGLAEMLKGGVIMDVTNAEQAVIAQEAGAVAVMALERIPSDIRKAGGIARMSQPAMIRDIQKAVSIPVMAKVRIGHFVEAQILEALGVDFIDESEVLTPADNVNHVIKHPFKVPFVCGCRNLGEALRRVSEGAAMIRTKGEAGSGDVVEAVRHMREVLGDIAQLTTIKDDRKALEAQAIAMRAPYDLVAWVAQNGKLPVPNFAAGGIATPADAALMMQLGAETVFVGSGIFASDDPGPRAKAIVDAVTFHDDPKKLLEVSMDLGEPMRGRAVNEMAEGEKIGGPRLVMSDGARDLPVGLLSLQGDFAKHEAAFRALGIATRGVRRAAELEGLRCLVIPGGESTTMTRLIDRVGLRGPLRDFAAERPVMGTCAGLIMLAAELADEIAGHGVRPLGLLDCSVRRNGYGTQVDSFDAAVDVAGLPGAAGPYPAVFIRAPRIVRTGPGVEVLARHGGEPVAVRQGRLLGLTFHPELTDDLRLHQAFLDLC